MRIEINQGQVSFPRQKEIGKETMMLSPKERILLEEKVEARG